MPCSFVSWVCRKWWEVRKGNTEEVLRGQGGVQDTEEGGTYTHAEGTTEIAKRYPGAGVARVVHCCEEEW